MKPIWNSQNTQSKAQVSIWAPSLDTGWTGASKTRILLSHYGAPGFQNPLRLRKEQRDPYMTLELTDNATLRMKRSQTLAAVMKRVFPHPVRYKESWHMKRGANSLFAWKPVAPEGFTALGMLFTNSDKPPDTRTIHCVPIKWVAKAAKPPKKVWDDTGAGGGKAGSMWIVNDMNMVVVVPGHDPPAPAECIEFANKQMYVEGLKLASFEL